MKFEQGKQRNARRKRNRKSATDKDQKESIKKILKGELFKNSAELKKNIGKKLKKPKKSKNSKNVPTQAENLEKSQKAKELKMAVEAEDLELELRFLGIRKTISQSNRGAVVIKNIRHSVTYEQIRDQLKTYGEIELLNLLNTNKDDSNSNKAYVFFRGEGVAAKVAQTLHNSVFLCKVVKANYIKPGQVCPTMFVKKLERSKLVEFRDNKVAEIDKTKAALEEEE